MSFEIINPEVLGVPKGYNNGMLAPAGGRTLFVAGQTARDAEGHIVKGGMVPQWDQALRNVLAVVQAAGGKAEHIGRMTVYVTDRDAYLASTGGIGRVWRKRMRRHYPAISLVQITGLVDFGAQVEIEATAIIP